MYNALRERKLFRALWSSLIITVFLVFLIWFFGSIHQKNETYCVPLKLDEGWTIEIGDAVFKDQNLDDFSFVRPTAYGETVTTPNHICINQIIINFTRIFNCIHDCAFCNFMKRDTIHRCFSN